MRSNNQPVKTQYFKRIIAREGLILLGLLFSGLLSLFIISLISAHVDNEIDKIKADFLKRSHSQVISKPVIPSVDLNTKPHNDLADKNAQPHSRLGFLLDSKEFLCDIKYYLLCFFWIMTYPIYLLVRFVFWAIETLNVGNRPCRKR